MNKNFDIKDGTLFDFSGELLDIRGGCELISVERRFGRSSSVEIKWRIDRSNQQAHIVFSAVEDFIIRGRDGEYPLESGTMLAIAGFSDGTLSGTDDEYYVEPTREMNYMSFVMDDMSAIFVKAGSVAIQRV